MSSKTCSHISFPGPFWQPSSTKDQILKHIKKRKQQTRLLIPKGWQMMLKGCQPWNLMPRGVNMMPGNPKSEKIDPQGDPTHPHPHPPFRNLPISRFDETLGGPLVAATAYREHAMAHLDTEARCSARGIRYEPLVFTTQGGCEAHAETVKAQIDCCGDRQAGATRGGFDQG